MDISNYRQYNYFGSHLINNNGQRGVIFRLWAPNAEEVMVLGSFNGWNGDNHIMQRNPDTGHFCIFIPNIKAGELYKYKIKTKNNVFLYKSDPFAIYSQSIPEFASIIADLEGYQWQGENWINNNYQDNESINIYELHLGSWKRKADNGFLNYKEIADLLVPYILEMGYTHIEPLPLMEHPNDGSWGYQITGYYSITSRYGDINDFKYFVDKFHKNGIGVILDWVPGHFCKDEHGLHRFDGTPLYEYSNQLEEENEWGTSNFDLTKKEVQNFLISNALFWLETYHIDGLRIDAVANMLYLNYGKRSNSGLKNSNGGNENIEAAEFLKELNETVLELYPKAIVISEEPTVWPNSTKSVSEGGLGFSYKWNMGFISDITNYMGMSDEEKKKNHKLITFSLMYAFSEKYILALSHDEVSNQGKSILNKMFGSCSEKYSGLRLLYGYILAYPGKKLQFMGCEFAQSSKWKYSSELDWDLLNVPENEKFKNYVRELNFIYKNESSLWELDHTNKGFNWIDCDNSASSTITFIRKGKKQHRFLIVACNFSTNYYDNFIIDLRSNSKLNSCCYREILNSNNSKYGGEGIVNPNVIKPILGKSNINDYYLNIKLAPLSISIIKPETNLIGGF